LLTHLHSIIFKQCGQLNKIVATIPHMFRFADKHKIWRPSILYRSRFWSAQTTLSTHTEENG